MNVIIIEDEKRTAAEMKIMLESIDHDISVLAVLTSIETAIKWFQEHAEPDLIFSDIQLGDGLSFEIFKKVEISAPVIFCTAYDQYAIAAFETNGIDYLLKPVEEDAIERSLQKLNRVRGHLNDQQYVQNFQKTLTQLDQHYKQSILIHHRDNITPVKVDHIQYIYVTSGVVLIHTIDNQDYPVQFAIDQLEPMLNPNQFFRVNRQFIVNREIIQKIEHFFNRRLVLKTKCATPEKIIISRLKSQQFLHWMEQ